MPIDDEKKKTKRRGTPIEEKNLHGIAAAVNGTLAAVRAAGGKSEPMQAGIVKRTDGEFYLVFRVKKGSRFSYHVFREVGLSSSQQNCPGVPPALSKTSNDAWHHLWGNREKLPDDR